MRDVAVGEPHAGTRRSADARPHAGSVGNRLHRRADQLHLDRHAPARARDAGAARVVATAYAGVRCRVQSAGDAPAAGCATHRLCHCERAGDVRAAGSAAIQGVDRLSSAGGEDAGGRARASARARASLGKKANEEADCSVQDRIQGVVLGDLSTRLTGGVVIAGRGRFALHSPAGGAQRAQRGDHRGDRRGAAGIRSGPHHRRHRAHRQRSCVCRRGGYQGDGEPEFRAGATPQPGRLHGPHRRRADAAHRCGARVCAGRRLRAGHGLRHRLRRGRRAVRSAGGADRHHTRLGWHAAAVAGDRQGPRHGHDPHRPPHIRCRSGTMGSGGCGVPQRAVVAADAGDGRQDRRAVATGGADGQGGGECGAIARAGRRGAVRARPIPGHLCAAGSERGHECVCG
eukprot:ctg_221.g82